MDQNKWNSMLYTEEEFHQLYALSDGFNKEILQDHPIRPKEMTFEEFIDQGAGLLVEESPEFIKMLA